MIYPEYELYKSKYLNLQEQFNMVLTEKERLITKLLPNATTYDKDNGSGAPSDNPLEDYVISLEEEMIDAKLDRLRPLLEDRKTLLESKEQELRVSGDCHDKIYRMKYLDGYGINRIAKIMHYSKSQVYRILEKIDKRCGKTHHAKKCDSKGDTITE